VKANVLFFDAKRVCPWLFVLCCLFQSKKRGARGARCRRAGMLPCKGQATKDKQRIRKPPKSLPEPDLLAREIADDLQAAMEQFQAIADGLKE
jgi:hypothetical protein